MCFYPGTGLPKRYDNHFFLCDFLGGDEYSQVWSFAVEPDGAGYKVTDAHHFVDQVLCTDVDFGWDGRMYVSDWAGDGWFSDRTGQLFAIWDPERIEDVDIRTAQNFAREGARALSKDLLLQALWHPDIRIRQRAHLELARRGEACIAETTAIAADGGAPIAARFHALWAVGVRARLAAQSGTRSAKADASVLAHLGDEQPEMRRLAARLAGDAALADAGQRLVELLTDEDARVRAQAAIALGKLRFKDAFPNLAALVWENDGQDPFLRHAAVMGLVGMDLPDKVHELAADPFPQTRLAAVLAMRRTADPQLARLLHDPDVRVATEAARAINDLPIAEAMPALASLAARWQPTEEALAAAAEAAKSKAAWTRELWKDRKGFTAARLEQDAVWGTKPDREEFGDECVGFAKSGNDYVQRVRGTFTAPADGEYAFGVASDDDGLLLLGRIDGSGGGAALSPAAKVENYVNPGDWESQPGQVAKVTLKAGERVAVEARSFQGGGGNHLAVGVVHPDGRREQPIGAFVGDASAMPLLRRVINANLRVGTPEGAAALAAMAANPALPPPARLEAVEALAEFPKPEPRDRVIGHWRPVDAGGRSMDAYLTVLKQRVPSLAVNAPSAVRTVARELAAKHSVPMDSGAALAAVLDRTKPAAERVACLVQLAGDRDAKLQLAIDAALTSDEPRLRAQARTIVARQDPALGVTMLAEALAKGAVPERQAALAALAALGTPQADTVLAAQAAELEAGKIAPELALDAYEAAAARPGLADAAARIRTAAERRSTTGLFALALTGGDAERGRQVVNFHSAAACLRCHQVEGTGGHAAPSLAGVAARHDRQGLLDSLIAPNAKVAEGFGPVSSMPAMNTLLTPREVRDVVEYLATLR
jgi:mono/diheme cytochrome c family protein